MGSPTLSLRRRAIRRPHFRRDDLRIEIRDVNGDISSDDDDSPSPSRSKFPPGARPTSPPSSSPPRTPPVVLNPASRVSRISSASRVNRISSPRSSSSSSSSIRSPTSTNSSPRPTTPPIGPRPSQPSQPPSFFTSVTSESSVELGWTPTAIAFGTIAIAALFLVLGVAIWWCVRCRKRRRARRMHDRNISPDGSFWDPSAAAAAAVTAAPVRRSPSSVMAELMDHAYAAENGHGAPPGGTYPGGAYYAGDDDADDRNSLAPRGYYLDEKRHDSDHPARHIPIPEPAPVAQPDVRNSFASWVRRHHPLKQNPMSGGGGGGRNSVYSTRSLAASNRSVNHAPLPPVPAVPDVYRSSDRLEAPDHHQHHRHHRHHHQQSNRRYTTTSSRYDDDDDDDTDESPSAGYNTNSLLALYNHTQPRSQHPHPHPHQQQQQPGQPPWLMDPPPVVFRERGVSMAPTEATTRTESTWRSWGAGVTQPRHHHHHQHGRQRSQPGTRGWIEKCINFGGMR
ncbi:hypothetical protein CTA1_8138 [Colletotrichum tanaceti]|uniref:Uncharacterized protein n=1 Tax=Colletotrichum tanaceti TaxID=1306861 RepID=A0A4U6XAX3_9PEZI|nr:hypothetical protein CTA1_8138 [Colletotrichum tanaceti]